MNFHAFLSLIIVINLSCVFLSLHFLLLVKVEIDNVPFDYLVSVGIVNLQEPDVCVCVCVLCVVCLLMYMFDTYLIFFCFSSLLLAIFFYRYSLNWALTLCFYIINISSASIKTRENSFTPSLFGNVSSLMRRESSRNTGEYSPIRNFLFVNTPTDYTRMQMYIQVDVQARSDQYA